MSFIEYWFLGVGLFLLLLFAIGCGAVFKALFDCFVCERDQFDSDIDRADSVWRDKD